MALLVLTDCTTWVHDRDFTTDTNQLQLTPEVESKDATTFGSGGWRARKGGLRSVDVELGGFWDVAPDEAAFSHLGTADHAVTISPTGAETAVAYLLQAGRFKYEQFGPVGELAPFKLMLQSTNTVGMARGQVAKAKAAVSATGALGSPVNLGAGAAGKYLYATLHIIGTPGTTITVQVQSDNASNFPSPTTVATIGPLTAAGGTFMTRVDASAITDTWYRFNVSAITGTFTVAGALAVQ